MAKPAPTFLERYFPHTPVGDRQVWSFQSAITGAPYEIRADFPKGHTGPLSAFIYLDGNLPSARPFFEEAGRLMAAGKLPPLLMVGVAHPHQALRKRNRDFLPGRREQPQPKRVSGAHKFYQCLVREVIPQVRERYPVTEDWGLGGHSMGGLFVHYARLQAERPFHRFLALSPSLWLYHRNMVRLVRGLGVQNGLTKGRLFQAAGALERFNLVLGSMEAFSRKLKLREEIDLAFREAVYPWKDHFTSVRPGVREGLQFLYPKDQ